MKRYKKIRASDRNKSDDQLNRELKEAVKVEDYERAAELRDLIEILKEPKK